MGPLSIDSVSTGSVQSAAASGSDTATGLGGAAVAGSIDTTAGGQSSATPGDRVGGTSGFAGTTALSIHTQADALVASFGSKAQGDQSLRMIIALLILEALLGKDGGKGSSKASEMGGLAAGFAGFTQRTDLALFSSTNIVQLQHQSTQVYTDQAVQTSAGSSDAGGAGAAGTHLDVTA